jgi:predicted cupin superfamily sugar epimerase
VAPGFDFEGFELAERASLQALFPQHHHLIESLTGKKYFGLAKHESFLI